MNRTEFILVTAAILFAAFAFGWFSYWLLHRFRRVQGADMGEMDRLAQELHEAEEARDEALVWIEAREAELLNSLAQKDAELRAAMEGLRIARSEVERLRAHLDRAGAG